MAQRPTVERTRWGVLAIAGVVGAGLTWIGLSAVDGFGWPTPPVPVLTPVVVGVLALATWLAARWTHRTVQVRRRPVEPGRAVALLLSGKAALIGGVALAAGYAAVAVRQLPDLDAELPRERVLVAVAVSLLSVGLALAGAALERACRIPGPPDDESGDAPTTGPGEPGPSD